MDSRTGPMNPNQAGDDAVDAEIDGEQAPLKMHEEGAAPPPGSLEVMDPATASTEDNRNDPGLVQGSRDPVAPNSPETDGHPESQDGDTPFDAQGTMGSEGE